MSLGCCVTSGLTFVLPASEIFEAQAFALALNPPAKPDSETPFLDVFGITLEAFYASLAQYPAIESGEDWFEGTVLDASAVMPSKDLTLTAILQPTG